MKLLGLLKMAKGETEVLVNKAIHLKRCGTYIKEAIVKAEQLQTKLDNIQRQLDHILGEKTPTELRIEKIVKGE